MYVAPLAADGLVQQRHAPGPHVARDEQCRVPCMSPPSPSSCRLATRRDRARARPAARRPRAARAARLRPARRTVRRADARSGFPLDDHESVWRVARRLGLDAFGARARAQLVARDAQPVDAQRQRRGVVVELHHRSARVEPVALEPARHQPIGMRMRDAEIGQLPRSRSSGPVRPRGQRQAIARCARVERSTAFTKPLALAFRPLASDDRIVDDRRRRHAVEVEQLIEAQPQDRRRLSGSMRREARAGNVFDQIVEARCHRSVPVDDLRRERAVALVGELAPARERARPEGRRRSTATARSA